MTTIAWDGKTLAGDGLSTNNYVIVERNAVKVHKMIGHNFMALFGIAGSAEKSAAFKKSISKIMKADSIDNAIDFLDIDAKCDDLGVILVFKAGTEKPRLFKVEKAIIPIESFEITKAIGCGIEFALAAMDHGKTAREAVEYAATRNVYTGGLITVVDFES